MPSIGACVRQIFFKSGGKQGNVEGRPRFASERGLDDPYFLADDSRYYDDYIVAVQALMSNLNILPHLSVLSWVERLDVPPSILHSIVCSSIQHLLIDHIHVVQQGFKMEMPIVLASPVWSLRALDVDSYQETPDVKEGIRYPVLKSILYFCSATLESLTLRIYGISDSLQGRQCSEPSIYDTLDFPRLRYLTLDIVGLQDSSFLRAIVSDRLHALELDTNDQPITIQFIRKRGAIPSLHTLVWPTIFPEESGLLDFLRDNTQISKLDFPGCFENSFTETQLLPLLASSFTRLTSLSLGWDRASISLSTLEIISTLQSLQQFCIFVGSEYYPMPDWLPRHQSMRSYLGQLTNLRKLALGGHFCDYKTPSVASASSVVDEDIEPVEWDENIGSAERVEYIETAGGWEAIAPAKQGGNDGVSEYQELILSQANEYVAILPELEWLYLGRMQMDVTNSSGPEPRSARIRYGISEESPYHTESEEWSLMRNIYGWERDS
ncbi:hypothetical protein MMC34_005202 [Xylographa carneopallida]|nr:hypothetical protein [Xylographa carneopallida]